VSKAASEGQRWSVKHGYTAFPKLTALLPDRKSVVASARTMALFPPRVLLRTQALTERFAQLTRERLQRSRGRFPPDWRDLTGWASNNWRVLRSWRTLLAMRLIAVGSPFPRTHCGPQGLLADQ
jgi:hypothetical protein